MQTPFQRGMSAFLKCFSVFHDLDVFLSAADSSVNYPSICLSVLYLNLCICREVIRIEFESCFWRHPRNGQTVCSLLFLMKRKKNVYSFEVFNNSVSLWFLLKAVRIFTKAKNKNKQISNELWHWLVIHCVLLSVSRNRNQTCEHIYKLFAVWSNALSCLETHIVLYSFIFFIKHWREVHSHTVPYCR